MHRLAIRRTISALAPTGGPLGESERVAGVNIEGTDTPDRGGMLDPASATGRGTTRIQESGPGQRRMPFTLWAGKWYE